MRFHFGGKYTKEEDLKAKRDHHPKAVPFKEPGKNQFALLANGLSVSTVVILGFAVYKRIGAVPASDQMFWGFILSFLVLLPHEFLHALCFKEDVYLYYNPTRLLLSVHGTEDMSKARFVFLSLLPNIIFGFIPFIIFMVNPSLIWLGTFGVMSIAMGFGDYINVFNALTQMPRGAMTYLSGFHSYWYKED
ncbi:MAG: DUF3267 domain-containing protein [Lachnospiraceae bacterium]|nr:DUF3267 domain-containing protein [Lachnospiraceae bacterium]